MNLRPIFIYFFEKPGFGAEIAGFSKKYAALSERRGNRALKSTPLPKFQLVSERHQKSGAFFRYRKYYAYVQNTTCPQKDVKVTGSYFYTPCFYEGQPFKNGR